LIAVERLSKKAEVKQILETMKEDGGGNPCGVYKD